MLSNVASSDHFYIGKEQIENSSIKLKKYTYKIGTQFQADDLKFKTDGGEWWYNT